MSRVKLSYYWAYIFILIHLLTIINVLIKNMHKVLLNLVLIRGVIWQTFIFCKKQWLYCICQRDVSASGKVPSRAKIHCTRSQRCAQKVTLTRLLLATTKQEEQRQAAGARGERQLQVGCFSPNRCVSGLHPRRCQTCGIRRYEEVKCRWWKLHGPPPWAGHPMLLVRGV